MSPSAMSRILRFSEKPNGSSRLSRRVSQAKSAAEFSLDGFHITLQHGAKFSLDHRLLKWFVRFRLLRKGKAILLLSSW